MACFLLAQVKYFVLRDFSRSFLGVTDRYIEPDPQISNVNNGSVLIILTIAKTSTQLSPGSVLIILTIAKTSTQLY